MIKRCALLLTLFSVLLFGPMSSWPASAQPNVEQINVAAARGRQWLLAHQHANGSWGNAFARRDTAEALSAFAGTNDTDAVIRARDWLVSTDSVNTDYLARKIRALNEIQATPTDIQCLLEQQRPDGGFGLSQAYRSDPLDTALALQAIMGASTGTIDSRRKSADFLASSRNPDGGWPLVWGGETHAMATAEAIIALAQYTKGQGNIALDEEIARAAVWLASKQNPAGGWGEPADVVDTALGVSALAAANRDVSARDRAVAYLLSAQAVDGSWNQDAYATVVALGALSSNKLNVSIFDGDVTASNPMPNAGESLVISARVNNSGSMPVQDLTVRFYLGDPQAGGQPLADSIIPDLPAGADHQVQYS